MITSNVELTARINGAAYSFLSEGGGRKKAAFFGEQRVIDLVYAEGRRERVASLTDLYPTLISLDNFEEHADRLQELKVIFSTWSMPSLGPAELDRLPSLKAVFYAAGSVQDFAYPLFKRDILVVSAWRANAIPVAEFTVAQILLSTKSYWSNTRQFRQPDHFPGLHGRGNYGATVAILGAGAIGSAVIERLKPFRLKVVVFDPFLSNEDAVRLGVEKVSLREAFERAYIVSNHLADVPETRGMLDAALFARLPRNATFINTGRGATVAEPEMISVLRERPDLTVLLDVTWPEPPESDSLLFSLPNVWLSPHIAGSVGDEVLRMADFCIEEFCAWEKGEALRYAVSPSMLANLA